MSEEFEVKSEELEDRAHSVWIMELPKDTPIAEAEGNPNDGTVNEDARWMGVGTHFSERDRAIATVAFHERQTPGQQRIVRVETRVYVEHVSPEEFQKWHDLAAKGDAEKAARNQQ